METAILKAIQTSVEIGMTAALVNAGLSSGELTQRNAIGVYGKWFKDAIAQNRIQPCRIDSGARGTKYYKVADILSLRCADEIKATLI